MTSFWQLQDAKQRYSELVLSAGNRPQFVTKHGTTVAVVIDIAEYRRLRGETRNFKEFLRGAGALPELQIDRRGEAARVVYLSDDR